MIPALNGLKVLDLTRVRAGPTCCRVLADFGAEVIKIEAPEGVDPNAGMSGARHGYDMLNLHRNKRSLTLNLKTAEGISIFQQMAKTADVVVENFRPDVKTRLGIDYEELSALNPKIILASISGFGQTGPYKYRAGFDQVAQGMGGLMSVTGIIGGEPMRAGTAVADSSAGLYAATGILIALMERHQSGLGQWVQTSLLQAQIAMMDFQAARYLIEKEVPRSTGNEHPYSTPMGVVATKDGHINLAVGGDGHWQSLCAALDKPQWQGDPKFSTGVARFKNRELVWRNIKPLFAEKTTAEWVRHLDKYSVPVGPIYDIDEMFNDPQVQHLGIAQKVHHPVRGDISLVGQPVDLSRTPAKIKTASPDAGEHTAAILKEFGYSDCDVTRLRSKNVV